MGAAPFSNTRVQRRCRSLQTPSLSTSTPAQHPRGKSLRFEHTILPPGGAAGFLNTVGFILKLV